MKLNFNKKSISICLCVLLSLGIPCYAADTVPDANNPNDSFMMEDFQEPIPEFGKEPVVAPPSVTADTTEARSTTFSVKKRTYLIFSYGGTSFPTDSWINKELKDANTTYNATYGKGPYAPIYSGATGGLEVRKGWSDNIMFGLQVMQSVGESPERTINSSSPKGSVKASVRYDVTSTFFNVYLYGPMADRWDYFLGIGPGISSGIVEWTEKATGAIVTDYENSWSPKAFGGQILAGVDWKMFDNFLLELNVFYRAMEMQTISLTGGGGTLALVTSF